MTEGRQWNGVGVETLTEIDAESLLDRLPGMVYRRRWDGDWTMEFVSQGSRSLTGYAPDDLKNDGAVQWGQVIYSEDLPDVARAIRKAVSNRKPFQIEYRVVRSDGAVSAVLEEGRVVSPQGSFPHNIEGYIVDIHDQKSQEENLQDQQKQARLVVEKVPEAFLSVDSDGTISDWNGQAERTFGWSREEALGRNVTETILPPDERESDGEGLASYLSIPVPQVVRANLNMAALRRNGERFPIEMTIWPSVRKGVQLINAFVRDLSERRALEGQLAEAEATLARLRREDPLTGLLNRQALKDDLARSISFARRWKQPLALLVADLDGFRAINDQIGRAESDELLSAFSEILKSSCRLEDLTARLEGDEFAILLPNTGMPQAKIVGERLRNKTGEASLGVPLTVSVGLTDFRPDDDVESLISRATKMRREAADEGHGGLKLSEEPERAPEMQEREAPGTE